MFYFAESDTFYEYSMFTLFIIIIPVLVVGMTLWGLYRSYKRGLNRNPLALIIPLIFPAIGLAWFEYISKGYYRGIGYILFLIISYLTLGIVISLIVQNKHSK